MGVRAVLILRDAKEVLGQARHRPVDGDFGVGIAVLTQGDLREVLHVVGGVDPAQPDEKPAAGRDRGDAHVAFGDRLDQEAVHLGFLVPGVGRAACVATIGGEAALPHDDIGGRGRGVDRDRRADADLATGGDLDVVAARGLFLGAGRLFLRVFVCAPARAEIDRVDRTDGDGPARDQRAVDEVDHVGAGVGVIGDRAGDRRLSADRTRDAKATNAGVLNRIEIDLTLCVDLGQRQAQEKRGAEVIHGDTDTDTGLAPGRDSAPDRVERDGLVIQRLDGRDPQPAVGDKRAEQAVDGVHGGAAAEAHLATAATRDGACQCRLLYDVFDRHAAKGAVDHIARAIAQAGVDIGMGHLGDKPITERVDRDRATDAIIAARADAIGLTGHIGHGVGSRIDVARAKRPFVIRHADRGPSAFATDRCRHLARGDVDHDRRCADRLAPRRAGYGEAGHVGVVGHVVVDRAADQVGLVRSQRRQNDLGACLGVIAVDHDGGARAILCRGDQCAAIGGDGPLGEGIGDKVVHVERAGGEGEAGVHLHVVARRNVGRGGGRQVRPFGKGGVGQRRGLVRRGRQRGLARGDRRVIVALDLARVRRPGVGLADLGKVERTARRIALACCRADRAGGDVAVFARGHVDVLAAGDLVRRHQRIGLAVNHGDGDGGGNPVLTAQRGGTGEDPHRVGPDRIGGKDVGGIELLEVKVNPDVGVDVADGDGPRERVLARETGPDGERPDFAVACHVGRYVLARTQGDPGALDIGVERDRADRYGRPGCGLAT